MTCHLHNREQPLWGVLIGCFPACSPFSVARRECPLEKAEMTLIQADAALLFRWEIWGYVTSERFIKLPTFELAPNEIIVFIAGFRSLDLLFRQDKDGIGWGCSLQIRCQRSTWAGAAAPWMNTELLCAREESILVSGQRWSLPYDFCLQSCTLIICQKIRISVLQFSRVYHIFLRIA